MLALATTPTAEGGLWRTYLKMSDSISKSFKIGTNDTYRTNSNDLRSGSFQGLIKRFVSNVSGVCRYALARLLIDTMR